MTTETNRVAPDAAELARIAAELRALGEPELDLELEATAFAAAAHEPAVFTAFALVYPEAAAADAPELGALERQRVWRKLAQRRGDGARPRTPSWRATWVAVATAAGVALVPLLSPHGVAPERAGSSAAIEQLGVQARSALEGVPGAQDRARAEQLAAQYAARLGTQEGR